MSNAIGENQIKAELFSRLGQPLGEVYFQLREDILWLNVFWNRFIELYGSVPARIEVMNDAAPEFFFIVQQSLANEVILRIARLVDPVKQGQFENLSVGQLKDNALDDANKSKLSGLVDEAIKKSSFAVKHRHKRLAHRDIGQALDRVPPLDPARRNEIQTAIDAIAALVQFVEGAYFDRGYRLDVYSPGSGAAIVINQLAHSRILERWKFKQRQNNLDIPAPLRDFPQI